MKNIKEHSMKMISRTLICFALATILFTGSAIAIPLGANITIWDKDGSGSGWSGIQEDQEVTPGCVTGQQWDLEGFYLDGYTLTMVGGYNFKDGEKDPYRNNLYPSGDLFINVDTANDTDGYDYVVDLDFSTNTFNVLGIDGDTVLSSVYFSQNSAANPWQYVSGGDDLHISGIFSYYSGLGDSDVDNLLGGSHNAVVLDLGFLQSLSGFNGDFITHFTMQCGNDNLMGKGTAPVPEPATLLLLGSGLLGLAGFRRKTK